MSKQDEGLIQSWLDKMEIPQVLTKQISELSGGQLQRVYLIRAFISNPDTLIMDEPTSALDPVFRGKFFESLKSFYNNGEKTIIYVTHELELLEGVKSKTLFVDQRVEYFEDSDEYIKRVKGHYHV
ncbi:MAG: ATP-binding cassette domain-containing protein [Bacilli bacterium]|nr:ATP-binding cassette domain-containing protein [Bacilli bacterium]